jgi:hypothetical protein
MPMVYPSGHPSDSPRVLGPSRWSLLHAVLRFLTAARRFTDPIHASMSGAAAIAALLLSVKEPLLLVLGAPLCIVAAALAAGTLAKHITRRRGVDRSQGWGAGPSGGRSRRRR